MIMIKRLIYTVASLLAMAGCERGLVYPVEYRISLDPSNTYYAGEPVVFNIEGNVDNLLFYSGETGHSYEFADRFYVPVEQVNSCQIIFDIMASYGRPEGLEIWISNSFEGLKGDDGMADRATIQEMVDGGMQGWTKFPYNEGPSTQWTEQEAFDLSPYMDNFCIALHWNPVWYVDTEDDEGNVERKYYSQRTYRVKGDIVLDLEGLDPSTMDFTDIGWTTVMMNEELDPYYTVNNNGAIRLDNLATNGVFFQGANADELTYRLDGWAISTPRSLNAVPNDKAIVIKNMQNYLHSYSYTFEKPGIYTVTFVGVNSNVDGESDRIFQYEIEILDRISPERGSL